MRICPECHQSTTERICPHDGSPTLLESALRPKADPLIGKVFDERYEVLDRIGRGGMGSVYRARQLTVGRMVALKVLNPALAEDAEAAGRFVREARVATRLHHPNTIVVYDFGHTEQGLYMVMELLEGAALLDRLKLGPMSPKAVAELGAQMCRSLAEAHEANIVHRDLKPANIYLHRVHGGREVVKVLDFGVAKFLQDQHRDSDESLFETNRPVLVGTIQYMSPEQIRGKDLDGRSDLYAVGIIMHECLTGERPFDGDTPLVTLRRQVEDPPPPLPSTVPAPLREMVAALLAKVPIDRPATALNVAERLEAMALSLPDVVAKAPAPTAAPNPLSGEDTLIAVPSSEVHGPPVPAEPAPAPALPATSADDWGAIGAGIAETRHSGEYERSLLTEAERLSPPRPSASAGAAPTTDQPAPARTMTPLMAPLPKEKPAPAAPPVTGPHTDVVLQATPSRGLNPLFGLLVLIVLGAAGWYLYQERAKTTAAAGADEGPGKLTLVSDPEGAEVTDLASGRVLGKTPITLTGDSRRGGRASVALDGFATVDIDLDYPSGGRTARRTISLEPLAKLDLRSDPPGAAVLWVEGAKVLGTTPMVWRVPQSALDKHSRFTLKFTSTGYRPREVTRTALDVRDNRAVDVRLSATQ